MRDSFRWTDYEEGILIEAVKEARAVTKGLANAAEILGTTVHVCRNRWYNHTYPALKRSQETEMFLPAAVEEEEVHNHEETVDDVKLSLEGFLSDLTRLVDENRRLISENARLRKELKELEQEHKEVKESYEYILRVINRARELCIQDEERPARIRYSVSSDGTVHAIPVQGEV